MRPLAVPGEPRTPALLRLTPMGVAPEPSAPVPSFRGAVAKGRWIRVGCCRVYGNFSEASLLLSRAERASQDDKAELSLVLSTHGVLKEDQAEQEKSRNWFHARIFHEKVTTSNPWRAPCQRSRLECLAGRPTAGAVWIT